MSSCFNSFLNKRTLCLEIWLVLENVLGTAILHSSSAIFSLTFHLQAPLKQATFFQHNLHSLWLIWVCRIIAWKHHLLCYSMSIFIKSSISHLCLFSTRVKIHLCHNKSILSICWVILRVIDRKQHLILWSTKFFNFLFELFEIHQIIIITLMFRTHLLNKELPISIPFIIFLILQGLACFFGPAMC